MEKIVIVLPGESLASRKLASIERKKIEHLIGGNVILHFDMKNIISISESYSDELFGVLVLNHGMEKVINSIRLENAETNTLASIASVMQRRIA